VKYIKLVVVIVMMCMTILLLETNSEDKRGSDHLQKIVMENGVPNGVTGIYLNNRGYDTMFEVLIFSLAIMAAVHYLSQIKETREFVGISDESTTTVARFAALMAGVVGISLATFGHLSPGGGFAAGVAGGTALVMYAITSDIHLIQAKLRDFRVEILEKFLVPSIIVLIFTNFLPFKYPPVSIPILNILIFLKVSVGMWMVAYIFMRHRGIL